MFQTIWNGIHIPIQHHLPVTTFKKKILSLLCRASKCIIPQIKASTGYPKDKLFLAKVYCWCVMLNGNF